LRYAVRVQPGAKSLDELEELAVLAVRALDALLDYQDYPIPAAKRGAMGVVPWVSA
jgi:ribonucleotide reductase alpha subunit